MRLLPVDVRRPRLAAAVALSGLAFAVPAGADVLPAPVPANPTADLSTAGNPEFSWAAIPRAAKYRLQVSSTSTFDTIVHTADVQSTTSVPTGELPLGNLFWRVAALDGGGAVGSFSAARPLTRTQPAAPVDLAPADQTAFTYPDAPPTLRWAAVAGMKTYKVQLDDEPTFTGATEYTTAGTSFSPADAVPSSVTRYWRVQGQSPTAGVTTAWTGARRFSIAWDAGAKPARVSPADRLDVNADDITFAWTPVPGAANYELQLSPEEDFAAQVTSQVTNATAYRPTSTPAQDEYFWRVRARQAGGTTAPWSDTWKVKREWLDGGVSARPAITMTDADPLTPGTQLRRNGVLVRWSAVPRASYYEIDVSTSPGFSSTDPTARQTCKTTHTAWTPYLSGDYTGTDGFVPCPMSPAMSGDPLVPTTAPNTRLILPGGTYYVRVRAVDKTPDGKLIVSAWSNEAREGEAAPGQTTFTAIGDDRPTTPGDAPAQVVDTPATNSDTPVLSWQPVEGAAAYRVALARDSGFNTRVTPTDTYFVTPNTDLVINEPLLDNTVGQAYFWIVTPCSYYANLNVKTCDVGDADAINVAGYFDSFTKAGAALSNLQTAAADDTVSFSWNPAPLADGGIGHYEVEVVNGSGVVAASVKTDAAGYTPVAKSYPDGPYTWRVRSIDGAGKPLKWSESVAFTKTAAAPRVKPVVPAGGLPVLDWKPTGYAASYDVEIFRGEDPAFPLANKVATANRPYVTLTQATTLPVGTYSWRVRQVDADGNKGPWAERVEGTTTVPTFAVGLDTPQVTAPADGGPKPVSDLVLRWNPVPGAVRYKVESSVTPAFTTLVDNTTTVATAFTPTVAHSGGTTYHWRVSALDADDHVLSRSADRSFVAQTAPLTPGAAKAAVSGSGVAVSWTAPDDGGSALTGYVVRYRPFGSDGAWSELATAADVASRTLPDLPPGQKYEAQVAALNALGTGPFSAVVSATTPTVPAVPGALKATGKAGAIGLTWSAPANGGTAITGYVVRGGGKETTVPSTSATLDGLTDGKSYGVEVAAVNAVGTGPFASTTGTAGAGAGSGSGSTGAPKASTLTLGGPAKIVFGRSTTLTGVLAAGTASLTGLTVTVESRPAGSSAAWAKGPVVKTEAKGAFTAIVTPTAGTEYRATFAGSPAATASTAKAIAVAVAPKLVLKAGLVRVRARRPVTLTGVATPKLKGLAVRVSCVKGKLPVTAKSTKTTTGGRFKVVLRPGIRGRVTCKAKSTAKSGLAAGTSGAAIVNVF